MLFAWKIFFSTKITIVLHKISITSNANLEVKKAKFVSIKKFHYFYVAKINAALKTDDGLESHKMK